MLPPDSPEVLRALGALLWRLERQGRPGRHAALVAAARRELGMSARTAEALAREAQDVDLQRRLEELILGRLEPWWLDRYLVVDELSAEGPPALYLGLAAPHPLAAVLALASARPGLCALYPACPPSQSRADQLLYERFSRMRERVPARWTSDVAAASAAFSEGRSAHAVLGADAGGAGAGGSLGAIERGRVLGVPWPSLAAAARAAGAEVRAVEVSRQRDKRWCVRVSPPLSDDELPSRLAGQLARWPGQTLGWRTAYIDGQHGVH